MQCNLRQSRIPFSDCSNTLIHAMMLRLVSMIASDDWFNQYDCWKISVQWLFCLKDCNHSPEIVVKITVVIKVSKCSLSLFDPGPPWHFVFSKAIMAVICMATGSSQNRSIFSRGIKMIVAMVALPLTRNMWTLHWQETSLSLVIPGTGICNYMCACTCICTYRPFHLCQNKNKAPIYLRGQN